MSILTEINAESREKSGKGVARSARREKKIPAIIYGKNFDSTMIKLDEHEIYSYFRKPGFMSRLFSVSVGDKKYRVLPRAMQFHPVTDNIEHIDFMYVPEGAEIKVSVPVHFLNEDKCIGIKRGGILNIVHRNLDLLCNVDAIPAFIEIDIANLEIGHSVHLDKIELPTGVRSSYHKDVTICTLVGRAADEPEAATTATPAAATEAKK